MPTPLTHTRLLKTAPKAALRHLLLGQRCSYPTDLRKAATLRLQAQLLNWCATHTHAQQRIALYAPHRYEPDVLAIAAQLNRPLALPKVLATGQALNFVAWQVGDTLQADRYGIATPVSGLSVTPTIVLVPCVGYNKAGYRLGYGGGYYDRSLALLKSQQPNTMALGVAFANSACDFQAEGHDVPMDGWLFA